MEDEVSKKSDEEIVKMIQSGQIVLFDILIERYEQKIKRYCQRFLSKKEDVEDILQDIFIKVYRNIQSFNPEKRFSPWIYRIAHNALLNVLKKRKIKVLSFIDLDIFLPHSLKENNSLEEELDQKNFKEIINNYLEKLDPKYREPIYLFYFENLSYQEIADVLEIPVATVGVRIKRGKEKIKKFIENFEKKYARRQ